MPALVKYQQVRVAIKVLVSIHLQILSKVSHCSVSHKTLPTLDLTNSSVSEGSNDGPSIHYNTIYAPPRVIEGSSSGARALKVLDLVVPMLQLEEGIRDPLIIETVTHIER